LIELVLIKYHHSFIYRNDVLHDAVDLGPMEGPEDASNAEAAGNNADDDIDATDRAGAAAAGCDDEEVSMESEAHGLLVSRHGGAVNSVSSGNGSNSNSGSGSRQRRRRLAAYFDAGFPRDPFALCTTCIGDKGMGSHCFVSATNSLYQTSSN
jgi:hypothetical protein